MEQTEIIPANVSQAHLPGLRITLKSALRHLPGTVWILLDYGISLAAVLAALHILPDRSVFVSATFDHGFDPRWYLFSFALVTITLAHILGLHEPQMPRDRLRLAINLLIVAAATAVILTTAHSVFFSFSSGQKVLVLSSGLSWVGIYLSRLLYWKITDEYVHHVCLIGDRRFLAQVPGELDRDSPPFAIKTVAIERPPVSSGPACHPEPENLVAADVSFSHPGDGSLKNWILRHDFDEIVTQSALPEDIMSPAVSCLDHGANVFSYPQFVEHHFKRVPVRQLESEWFLHSCLLGLETHYRIAKRLIDIGIATAGLVLTAPLVALAAIAIRLTSRGPVFYSQTRIGLYNQPFRIFKLRTMTVNAEHSGAQWAQKSDPRVTAVGRLLRKTRIDELPQFWNILRGDMAFIGPRPERPEFTRKLAQEIPFYEKRHLVKPGLTGWAQINYPYGASVEDALKKLEYDLFYVKHGSLQLDLHILVRTVGAVMKGAR